MMDKCFSTLTICMALIVPQRTQAGGQMLWHPIVHTFSPEPRHSGSAEMITQDWNQTPHLSPTNCTKKYKNRETSSSMCPSSGFETFGSACEHVESISTYRSWLSATLQAKIETYIGEEMFPLTLSPCLSLLLTWFSLLLSFWFCWLPLKTLALSDDCWGQNVVRFLIFWRRMSNFSGAKPLVTVTFWFHWSQATRCTSAAKFTLLRSNLTATRFLDLMGTESWRSIH